MNNISKSTVLTSISMAVLLTASTFLLIKSQGQRKDLLRQTSINQSLSETNARLKKEMKILTDDYDKNSIRLHDIIKENDHTIEANNVKISKLLAENSRGNIAIRKIKEYESENQRLQSEIYTIQERLTVMNNQSKEQSGRITNLEYENRLLREQNRMLGNMVTDNINVHAVKGEKNKLTVVAAKTGMLSATLDVPSSLDHLNYEIIDQNGKTIASKESASGIRISDPYTVTDRTNTGVAESLRTVEIKFQPTSKLKKGLYKLTVYNNEEYLTSVNISLR